MPLGNPMALVWRMRVTIIIIECAFHENAKTITINISVGLLRLEYLFCLKKFKPLEVLIYFHKNNPVLQQKSNIIQYENASCSIRLYVFSATAA